MRYSSIWVGFLLQNQRRAPRELSGYLSYISTLQLFPSRLGHGSLVDAPPQEDRVVKSLGVWVFDEPVVHYIILSADLLSGDQGRGCPSLSEWHSFPSDDPESAFLCHWLWLSPSNPPCTKGVIEDGTVGTLGYYLPVSLLSAVLMAIVRNGLSFTLGPCILTEKWIGDQILL